MTDTNGKGNGKPVSMDDNGCKRDALGRVLPGSRLNPSATRTSFAAQWRAEMNKIMEMPCEDDERRSVMQDLIWIAIGRARKGDMHALKLLWDRVVPAQIHATIEQLAMNSPQAVGVLEQIRVSMTTKERPELPAPKED